MEKIVTLLQSTFSAESTEEINAAEETLRTYCNAEYIPIFVMIVLNRTVNVSTRKAAVTYIRVFLESTHEIMVKYGIEILVQLVMNVSDDFQRVIEVIARSIVQNYEESGNISELLTAIDSLCSSDIPLPAFMLLSYVMNAPSEVLDEHKTALLELVSIEQSIIQSSRNHTELYLHYFVTTVREQLRTWECESDQLSAIVEFCKSVINSAIEGSISHLSLKEDCLETLATALQSYSNVVDCKTICETCLAYAHNKPSFEGLTNVTEIFNHILQSEVGYQEISDLMLMVLMLLADLLKLSDRDLENLETNQELFIEDNYPPLFEAATPKSGAMICLKNAVSVHPEIATAMLKIMAVQISDNPLDVFQWISFVRWAFPALESNESEVSEILKLVESGLFSSDLLMGATALQFLSGWPSNRTQDSEKFLLMSICAMAAASCPVIEYLSCCATGALLSVKGIDVSAVPNELVHQSMSVMLRCTEKYPFDATAEAMRAFVTVFADRGVIDVEEYLNNGLTILGQWMDSSDTDTRKSVSEMSATVAAICPYITNTNGFSMIIQAVLSFSDNGFFDTFSEEFLTLINACVQHCPEWIDDLDQVPSILMGLFLTNPADIEEVANIFKTLASRFGGDASTEIGEKVMGIVQSMTDDGVSTEEDQRALEIFAQTIFLILQRVDLIEEWFNIFTLDIPCLGNVACSMVQCAPCLSLSNQYVYRQWMTNSTPLSFVLSCVCLFSQWEALPAEIQALKNDIVVRIREVAGGVEHFSPKIQEFLRFLSSQ